jgi:hypothetical protein
MRDNRGLFVSLFLVLSFLIAGAVLFLDTDSKVDLSRPAGVICGAVFLSLVVAIITSFLKNWWRSKKEYEKYRNG